MSLKYSMIAIFTAAHFLSGPMAFATGESADIARFSQYTELTVYGKYKFDTQDIQRLYSSRGNRSLWFANGHGNGKIQALIEFMDNDTNANNDITQTWVPLLDKLYQGMTKKTWVSVEMVATHIVLSYLGDNNITDYRLLNKALAGNSRDLVRFLQKVSNGEIDQGVIGQLNDGQDSNNQDNLNQNIPIEIVPEKNTPEKSTSVPGFEVPKTKTPGVRVITIPEVTTKPLPPAAAPILPPQLVIKPLPVIAIPIGVSNAHYANDPTDEDVNQIYSFYNQSIWLDSQQNVNEMAAALKDTLRSANRHGLNPDDYWDTNLENMYKNAPAYGSQFELAATKAFLRFAYHVSGGRLDPKSVDPKLLKFELKKMSNLDGLVLIIQAGAAHLKISLDALAPQLPQYGQLMNSLVRLSTIKKNGTWKKIGQPDKPLVIGSTGTIVTSLRIQLAQLGYPNTGAGNVYDLALDQAVRVYLDKNGLQSMDYRFWNSLYKTVDESIQQVSVNMEKLRWIPANSASRYAVVNLAAQEIRLMSQGQAIMKFRTVNGSKERPTPSMLQQVRRVLLNPTWTTPMMLAIKDKIPAIKHDPIYMTKHNMYILEARTGKYLTDPLTGQLVTNLSSVDILGFTLDSRTNKYYFVQGPGNQNALGVLKFPLQNMDGSMNSDDIYMHDTNERELFTETMRYRSSGCIRLQFPLEFAAELLKNVPVPMTVDDIKAKTPWDIPDQVVLPEQTNQAVSLAKPLIVYIIYLTSEQNEDGSMRMFEDTYGIDAKIVEALKASI